ncbi:hypothetical protein A2943_02780 [Candidatus Adlerbacteria bacterium RIFCSPLOWO2_01_FULL_51_16]|uniref:Uncharacterized protein n=1 Tax=Candidatus Adlerbacteria bacterium RIFCSPLOWO2_01_FULL_51_16 TaxID=1797243 RepID=A0A1F4XGF7_9BACT|nr:MAG: hypothetical protein A2943_02780 [Candidatus Adlerbacteria bacterium RIFCSPLOWO2_01_FULL_51_16]
MKKYLKHIQSKEPHDRRNHALQIAGTLTAILFVGWVTTLGFRFGGGDAEVAQTGDSSQAASPAVTLSQDGGLQVSTTSTISY